MSVQRVDDAWVRALLRADAFPHPVGELQLIETHISWLLLTGDWVYKIKKPLDLGFLDFTSLQQRHFFCDEELRLNRRFAPQLYVEVVPIFGPRDRPTLLRPVAADAQAPLDYAVRMRQFEQRDLLDAVAARGELDASLLRRLAAKLAMLHGELPIWRGDDDFGRATTIAAAMRQNFAQIGAYDLDAAARTELAALEQWTEQQLQRHWNLLEQRRREGFVRECHGDPHLGNITLWQGEPLLFDCIEFNPAFRIVDTVAELAFLAMDLEARGQRESAWQLLSDYFEYRTHQGGDDYAGMVLLDFYRCYYALVRAKVALLERPAQEALDDDRAQRFRHYLALARSYSAPRPRFLALMHGVSGSGKSTVAMALATRAGAIRLRSDVERKRLARLAPEQPSDPAQREYFYSAAMSRRVFAQLEQIAAQLLRAGFAVVVDATFLHRRARAPFLALAQQLAVPAFILDCRCEEAELVARLQARRGDASEADVAVMRRQLQQGDPFEVDEQRCVRVIHSGDEAGLLPAALLSELGQLPR